MTDKIRAALLAYKEVMCAMGNEDHAKKADEALQEHDLYAPDPSVVDLLQRMQAAVPTAVCNVILDKDREGPGLLLVWDSSFGRAYRFVPLKLIERARGDLFGPEIDKVKQETDNLIKARGE